MAIEGEGLLAAVGLEAVIKPGNLRITAPQREAAAKWASGALFRKEMKRFLNSSEFGEPTKLEPFDYFETLELLATPVDVTLMEEKVRGSGEEALPLLMAAGVTTNYAFGELPKRTKIGALGPRPVLPDDVSLSRFRRQWAVLTHPETLFEELAAGTLTSAHVRAFVHGFPELADLLRTEVYNALIEYKAQNPKKTELPRRKDALIALLLGIRNFDELMGEMGANFEQAEQPAPGKKPLGTKSIEGVQTGVEKIALR